MVEPEKKPDSRDLATLIGLAIKSLSFMEQERGQQRAGFTKNHGRPRNKVRAKMSRESRRINRGR